MNVYLDRVNKKDKDVLYRLLQYSLYEESEFDGNEMKEDGTYEYKYFENYFVDKDRDAFFIREPGSDKILGFVMINTYVQKVKSGHSIAEFLVLPSFRRNGIGKSMAKTCFDMYKGDWEVSPSRGSELAYKFWKNVIDEYTNKNNKYVDGIFVFSNR